jgi:pimeloyl-ACP methyl ester carboxylesterase
MFAQRGADAALVDHFRDATQQVVLGKHVRCLIPVNALHLVRNMPNAKLIVYPDANHGSWYENYEGSVFETNRFLNSE